MRVFPRSRFRLPRGAAAHALGLAVGLALFSGAFACAVFATIQGWEFAPAWLTSFGGALFALSVLVLAAALVARRALAPLEGLARIAARNSGLTVQGDPYASLVGALNLMKARLADAQTRLEALAFVDPVTQLPNQERFQGAIEEGLSRAAGERSNSVVAVFGLRRISKHAQALEPHAARALTKMAAERVVRAVRAAEGGGGRAIVARLGAEQFGVYLANMSAPTEASRFVQCVNATLNEPFEWRGTSMFAGACAGAAIAPRDGSDAASLIRRARIAESEAERALSRVRFFSAELDRKAASHLNLEHEMRGALERNEFRAHFQPKINLASGRIEACEALARWVRPDQTIIGPGRFVPVAEESGLIGVLSDSILRDACWKAAAWARAGRPVKVAVNVSALQLHSARFATDVLRTISDAGLAPELLELEITESVAMGDPEATGRIVKPLRDAGVRLAIDDFGCGHSNLAALSILPFDVIKIDQQFIRALERGGERAAAIVDMILALARSLRLEVVAEGVERRAEADFMAARGCHWAQGFFYGAAVSAPEFAELLARQAEPTVSENYAA